MQLPTKTLTSAYRLVRSIDLGRKPALVIWLNIAALVLFLFFGYAYLRLLAWLRPDASIEFTSSSWLVNLLAILLVYGGVIILHEIIHGLFFWLITGEKPRFGFRGAYAYASAPEWYLPRNPYLVVGLSPFLLITLTGILLILFIPEGWLIFLGIAVTANASGAIGDLAVIFWLLWKHPAGILVRDRGDAIDIYHPA